MESEEYADFRDFDELQVAAVFDDIEDESDEAMFPASTSSSSAATGSTASGPESLPTTTSATATKRTPRKKAIPRPKTSFTLEKATGASEEILSEVITQMDSNEMVNEETFEHAPAVKHVTSVCRAALRERTYGVTLWTQFTAILTLLWPSIRASERLSLGSQRRQAMQQSFHSFRNTPVFRQAISNLCDQLCGIANPPIFFLQMFGRMLFQNLTLRHEQIPPQDQPATIRKFDAKEENALRYTSGYMAKALPNKIAHVSSGKAQMQQVIDNMTKGSNKETRLSYTKEWVTSQTRGGLKIVNDLTYLFFRQLETNVRNNLPGSVDKLRGTDIREFCVHAALSDTKLLEFWDKMSSGHITSEQDALVLLQCIVDFYIQIRGFSFARVILERYKMLSKKSTKGSRGLRTGLKRGTAAASTDTTQ